MKGTAFVATAVYVGAVEFSPVERMGVFTLSLSLSLSCDGLVTRIVCYMLITCRGEEYYLFTGRHW